MTKFNRLARRAALLGSLALVAVAATAVPLKPAAADSWNYNNHGRGAYGHNWHGGGYYRAPVYFAARPVYFAARPVYYPPAPVFYAPPPVYYPPAPVYGPPGISLNFVIPLHFR
jgi:hypothetical protein